jgi:putative transposase
MTHPYRVYGLGYLHYITSSCDQRRPFLTPQRRTLLLEILEQVRARYNFVVVGYVVMPEHFHLMISEPAQGTPSTVMQILKQRFARQVMEEWRNRPNLSPNESHALNKGRVWMPRFYDFPVWTQAKRIEKLRYMHRNPVVRGLVAAPQDWPWSSFRHYAYAERGIVLVNEQQTAEMKVRILPQQDRRTG